MNGATYPPASSVRIAPAPARPGTKGPRGTAPYERVSFIRLCLLLVFGTIGPISSEGAVNLVQQATTAAGGNTTTLTATYPATPTPGNLLVAILGNRTDGGAVTLPSGWTSCVQAPGLIPSQTIIYKVAGASEPTGVTMSVAIGARLGIHIYEFSGVNNAIVVGTVMNTGSGTAVSSGTVTTTGANELLISAVTINVSTSFSGWTNSFAEINDFQNTGAAAFRSTYAAAFREAGAAGSYSTTSTAADASDWIIQTVRFAGSYTISGTVYEDPNYGGGAGRDRATALGSGGSVRPNARVELYNSTGNFVASTLTNGSGAYTFSFLAPGNYTVRVVNSTVSSARAGYVPGTHLAVQTFRTDASSGTALGINDHVGGELPGKADAGNGSTTLAALTTATTEAQSIAVVTLGTSNVTGVDFGYSFDVICNTNNAGQGSLRQFFTNANALANAGLAIQGQAAGRDVAIFMIANGGASPGLNTGMPDLLTGGVARINLASALPAITETVTINGALQTTLVGNTNSGTVGTGGTVGVDAVPLALFEKPEVEINAGDNAGFSIAANVSNVNLEHMAVFNATTAIAVSGGTGSGNTMRGLFIGTDAQGASPGGALRNTSYGIGFTSPSSGIVDRCLAAYNGLSGILATQPSAAVTVTGNEVFGNGWNSNGHDGLDIDGANCVVRYNLTYGNINAAGAPSGGSGNGIEIGSSGLAGNMNNLIENNTSRDNVSNGLTLRSGANGNTIRKNIFTGNDIGLLVAREGSTARNNLITENSIHSNDQLGIDLSNAAAGGDGVTLNDMGDVDAGSNDLLNHPVIVTARVLGANLEVTGFATAGSTIEFFISDNDPSGFGEGQTYLFTAVEGSGADLDATTDTYGPGVINGIAQGTDNASRFSFSVPVPTGVVDGTRLTATARMASNTSEFAARVTAIEDFDLDDDGIPNSLELGDTDGDGVPDEWDLDSDNDGIFDCVESGVNAPHTNGVLNGVVNANGIPVAADTNGDGTIDYTLNDSDSDGNYDFTELDSDGDGCQDVIEAGYTDANSDGLLGPAPLTVDANGLVTSGNN